MRLQDSFAPPLRSRTGSKAGPVTVRDPDDAVTLGAALSMDADVLVTGDKDLLEAGEVPGIRILDPRGFWHLIRGAPGK